MSQKRIHKRFIADEEHDDELAKRPKIAVKKRKKVDFIDDCQEDAKEGKSSKDKGLFLMTHNTDNHFKKLYMNHKHILNRRQVNPRNCRSTN